MKPLEPLIGLSLLPTPYRAVLCCAVLMLFMLSDDTPPQYYIAYIETSLYFSHIFNFFFFQSQWEAQAPSINEEYIITGSFHLSSDQSIYLGIH